ncbi:P-loop containing nucleoside triphosphate hydrolase protein [Coniella lustricola]|uniref:RNA helicase n=1 Tax=Coniella lustricola TaxID=2025994 RepID=A0A2T3A2W6_9PEZI|nr:P-loop containing nucleoside triphosphate hydrolase protein [Coniella lustricola]
MGRRVASPTPSDAEADIFDSLYTEDIESAKPNNAAVQEGFDFLDVGGQDGADEDDDDEAFIALKQAASYRKTSQMKSKSAKKSGGGFQTMGLNENLLRAILRKGFKQPTPIQRKAIPLVLERRDVVGMARTGSGKTAAFVIPMIERLKAHSAKVGARALIMSPSRELALQTLKVVKEFGKGTDLKCVLLVGGDSLEEQFGFMTTNPDIVIATPGRFLHLKVEMSLSLSSIKYVVFDEADRLFEMGFAAQLTEILHSLPQSRQTLLFSATLPKSLVEFARAGLQDPSLVRLDAETKVSPDLESAFFTVKAGEKEAALLHVLHDVIKVPVGVPEGAMPDFDNPSKKRKRGPDNPNVVDKPTEHSTIVFASTKHHVEYLGAILREQGFAVSYVYGSLDQTARMIQVDNFRKGRTNILVVTDVAARGIDIPILANVINYDFPPQPKVFVHRVGRTARAGKKGWSFSILQDPDAPYLLDLQLFLDRRLVLGRQAGDSASYSTDMIVGGLQRAELEMQVEWLNKLFKENEDISALRSVAAKAEKLYIRTRTSASSQSAKRAKEIVTTTGWGQVHPIFGQVDDEAEQARNDMLARISNWTPKETIFEINMGKKVVSSAGARVMRDIRKRITPKNRQEKKPEERLDVEMSNAPAFSKGNDGSDDNGSDDEDDSEIENGPSVFDSPNSEDGSQDSESELEVTISKHTDANPNTSKQSSAAPWKDPEFFMSYTPRTTNVNEDKGYSITDSGGRAGGSSFVEATRDVTMDLTNDDGAKAFGEPARAKMRWDKKQNKYVNTVNDADGSRGAKSRMIKGESGVKIAASFQSGRFDRWRRAHRLGKLPHVGETERPGMARLAHGRPGGPGGPGGDNGRRHFKHKQEKAPKDADKFRDDYHVRKKRVAEARDKRIGKFKDGEGSHKEVKGKEDIRRSRKIEQRKREKNARPVKKGKR